MALHRLSDSLSRCDPGLYSNIYDVRKRPDIKHNPIYATQPTHKDTIEISKDKLKEEALNRLRHTSKYVIAQNSFIRIGKYLFLAIAFPPYLLVYGLPKWILVEGLPAIFSMCVWMWKQVQQKTKKPLNAVIRKVAQMVQFTRNFFQVLIQPIVRLALEVRQRLHRMRENAIQFFRQWGDRGKRILILPGLKIAEGIRFLQKRVSQVREKIARGAQTVITQLQESVQWVKQSPQILLNWGLIQFQRLNEQAISLKMKWSYRLQNPQKLAQRATTWVAAQMKDGLKGLKRNFAPLIQFYREQLLPPWRTLKKICQGRWRQTRDFFHQKHQKALAFLQNKQEKVKRLSSQHLIDGILSHAWMSKLPSLLQSSIKKWLSHPLIQSICEGGIKAFSFLARGLLGGLTQLLHGLSYGIKALSKACQFLQVYAKLVKQKVLGGIEIGYQACCRFAFNALYYFLLSLMIAAILFIWGMQSLTDLMGTLTRSLPFVKKPSRRI